MISKLISWTRSCLEEPSGPPAVSAPWQVAEVEALLRHFPIGCRALYSPEFKRELRLDSIILGCSINQNLIYSPHQIRIDGDAEVPSVALTLEEEEVRISQITSFYLVVPYQTRSEIDYRPVRRSDPDPMLVQTAVNDFEKGSIITLIAHNPYGRAASLETAVKGAYKLPNGYYANHRAAFLDPLTKTISHADKRAHRRVRTRIRAALRLPEREGICGCLLEDFSERFFRLRIGERSPVYGAVLPGSRVVVALEPAGNGTGVKVQGIVLRRSRGSAVVELKAVLRDGRFTAFRLIEQLELKALLLSHPETQRLLAAGDSSSPPGRVQDS